MKFFQFDLGEVMGAGLGTFRVGCRYLFTAGFALYLAGCEGQETGGQKAIGTDPSKLNAELSEAMNERREALGLPMLSPRTRSEWKEVCEWEPDPGNPNHQNQEDPLKEAACARIAETGYPFRLQNVLSQCLYDDENYGRPPPWPEYFAKMRRITSQEWQDYGGDFTVHDVCEAYKHLLEGI
ncbi:MAG: hypothetical protein ABJ242_06410 [Marinomonas sp.]|uniref:hypothetical protein n=1 Tax=Parasphingorhabdus sp. TaxID=2709688 RepID=UPI00328E62C1